ncbi:hypothetical protein LguiB_001291 [Lonicera macranthoides]
MALDHFSHDHPLILVDEARKEDDDKDEVVCNGCHKPILDSAYTCSKCDYFLHEKCAQLPKEILHPKHLEHPLTLVSRLPYKGSECICNVCHRGGWRWFTYRCSLCEFDIDMICATEERVVEHESHPHPLTILHQKVPFECDACGMEDRDSSYFCSTCEFWIHKSCYSSPSTFKHGDHDHPLQLNYFLPYNNRRLKYKCDVCKGKLHPNYWVYNCDRCRYFVHIKCAKSEPKRHEIIGEESFDDPNIMNFPIVGEPTDLLADILNKLNLGDDERVTELIHFSHDHPLSLFDTQNNNNQMPNDKIVCQGCAQPIVSVSFYGCPQCNFFLHKSCTEIPRELDHPRHRHQLKLRMCSHFVDYFTCRGCRRQSNGFAYTCEKCDFHLDIVCALLPVIIKHEAHEHPLKVQSINKFLKCNACDKYYFKDFLYGCDTCHFYIDTWCATMKRTVKHDWDRHDITLRYPPYSDHPDDFYCEICEEEIHPKFWLYHCGLCDQPFHTECLRPYYGVANIMVGGTGKVDIHPHTLTLIHTFEKKKSTLCQRCSCGKAYRVYPMFECAPCDFHLCIRCFPRNS